jgi:putative membrane protein
VGAVGQFRLLEAGLRPEFNAGGKIISNRELFSFQTTRPASRIALHRPVLADWLSPSIMIFTRFVLPFSLLVAGACSSDATTKDPVAEARFQNEKRIGDENITKKQERDAEFMVNAASGGLLAVELGKLAEQKATTPAVKELGRRLAAEHAGLNQTLQTLAAQKSISLPSGLGEQQQKVYQELSGLTGLSFDHKYLDRTVDDHANVVDDFNDMSSDAYDGDIRGFAAKYLPALKEHLDLAKQTQDQVPDAH